MDDQSADRPKTPSLLARFLDSIQEMLGRKKQGATQNTAQLADIAKPDNPSAQDPSPAEVSLTPTSEQAVNTAPQPDSPHAPTPQPVETATPASAK